MAFPAGKDERAFEGVNEGSCGIATDEGGELFRSAGGGCKEMFGCGEGRRVGLNSVDTVPQSLREAAQTRLPPLDARAVLASTSAIASTASHLLLSMTFTLEYCRFRRPCNCVQKAIKSAYTHVSHCKRI